MQNGREDECDTLDFAEFRRVLMAVWHSSDVTVMFFSVQFYYQTQWTSLHHLQISLVFRALVGSLANENALRIFRLGKKEDGSHNVTITGALTFPQVSYC